MEEAPRCTGSPEGTRGTRTPRKALPSGGKGEGTGKGQAQGPRDSQDLSPWRGPQCIGDIPGHLLSVADAMGLEKSNVPPLFGKGEREKNQGIVVLAVCSLWKNTRTHQKPSCGSLGGSGMTGTSLVTSARSHWGKTLLGPSLGSLLAQDGVQPGSKSRVL